MRTPSVLFGCVALAAVGLAAQGRMAPKPAPPMERPMSTTGNPLVESTKKYYNFVKDNLVKAAAEMPAVDYTFHPATMPASDKQEIRTFGALVGHVADANYLFCGRATDMTAPAGMSDNEHQKAKADLQAALKASFDFCDAAWAATTDQNASTPADLPENMGPSTRLGVLTFNTGHDAEHYGNVVTYLRAKGLVPPSSAPTGR
jgi:uncharacterized damage-inducible protein DinB